MSDTTVTPTTEIEVAPLTASQFDNTVESISVTHEPKVHGIVGAYFGDLEFDVGKSVRWIERFVDDLFITDIHTGEQRYWVINWTETFPKAEYNVSSTNFFVLPTKFRQEQFAAAKAKFGYEPGDWVLWIDAHEGLSVDNRSLPDDFTIEPFKTFVYREITRAAGGDKIVLPFFAYLKDGDLQNVTYDSDDTALFPVKQAISVPYYLPYQGLLRLMKVSVLEDPQFDWSRLDQPQTPTANTKLQVLSYGYAHWNIQDIPPGATEVPPLDANNDLGWQMRLQISKVRPLPGVPLGPSWVAPNADPTSYPGPWGPDTVAHIMPDFDYDSGSYANPAAQTAGIRSPLYETVIRLNLRDGLFYQAGNMGNVPLMWDDTAKKWLPRYDPNEWPDLGTDAAQNDPLI